MDKLEEIKGKYCAEWLNADLKGIALPNDQEEKRWLIAEVESLRKQLASANEVICGMREAIKLLTNLAGNSYDSRIGDHPFWQEWKDSGSLDYFAIWLEHKTLSSSFICPHIAEEIESAIRILLRNQLWEKYSPKAKISALRK